MGDPNICYQSYNSSFKGLSRHGPEARRYLIEYSEAAAKYAGTEIHDRPLLPSLGSSDFNSRARIVVGVCTRKFRARQTRSRAPEVFPIFSLPLFVFSRRAEYRQISFIKFHRANALEEFSLRMDLLRSLKVAGSFPANMS